MDGRGCLAVLSPRAAALAALALAPALPAPGQEWNGTGHAVVVGISDYPGTDNDLDWCDDDAREIYDTLLSDPLHWSVGNVRLLLDSDATYDAIDQAISEEFAEATGPEDVCLFFFTGHGTRVDDTGPGDEDPGDDYDEALFVPGTPSYILDDDLEDWLWAQNGKRICVILDVCRAGGMAKSVDMSADLWGADFASDVLEAFAPAATVKDTAAATRDVEDSGQTGIVMLMSCEDLQLSEEDPVLRNGVFSYFVIEALRRLAADADGSGYVSAEEVFAYAFPLVVDWNPDQTPELYDTDPGWEMDLLTAADRRLDKIVTPEDFPFGGEGCSAGARGAPWTVVVELAALGLAAFSFRRRRAARALVLMGAVALVAGCAPGPPAATEGPGLLTARAGMVVPFAERRAPYRAGPEAGLALHGVLPWRGIPYELGGDVFVIDGDGYDVTATIASLRADVTFAREDAGRPWVGYVNAGPRALLGGATTYWGSGFDGTFGLGVAAGVRRPEKGADFRAGLDWLPRSGNIRGIFGLTAGVSF